MSRPMSSDCGNTGHRHDRSTLTAVQRLIAAYRRGGQPDAVERADQIDCNDLLIGVEFVRRRELAILADRALCPTDACGVDQDAQWAEFSRLVDGRLDLRGVGDIDADERAADIFGKFCPTVGL